MVHPSSPSDLVEIYQTDDALEADAIRDEVLAPNQVKAVILDRTSHPFNTPTMSGGLYIAVAPADAPEARALLREARKAGVISAQGDFV